MTIYFIKIYLVNFEKTLKKMKKGLKIHQRVNKERKNVCSKILSDESELK